MNRDYSQNCKKKKKKLAGLRNQIKHMSKEALQAAVIKKKKCNDRAIEIVNLLIEPVVSEELLLSCLFEINQSHFDDIIEERAIQKICGYPLCDKPLTNVPQKQFHISTKTNKVYDITERKSFCCNSCYKAGKYLKDQLYTGPLWLREQEEMINFKLLPLTVNSGSSGEEVYFGSSHVSLDDIGGLKSKSPDVLSEDIGGEKLSNDCDDEIAMVEDLESRVEQVIQEEMICDNMESGLDTSAEISSRLEAIDISCEINKNIESENIKVISENISQDDFEVNDIQFTSQKNEEIKVRKAKSPKKTFTPKDIIIKIENVMRSWLTFETYCFVLGEGKVREELDGFGLQLQHQNSDPYLYDRYADLCKRLNLLELEETYGSKDVEPPKKPLPDFNKLKEESTKLEIKVKSFFKGNLEFEVADEQLSSPSDEPLPVLPALDHYATKAARRRIFLQKLCRSLPDIQGALGLTSSNLNDLLRDFAATLNLTAQNISLKPSEWNIVAIVLIKMFSLRDGTLKEGLSSKKASDYLELILMSYTLDSGYLDRLVCWLLDINYLVNANSS